MRHRIIFAVLTTIIVLCVAASAQAPTDPVRDALAKLVADNSADTSALLTLLLAERDTWNSLPSQVHQLQSTTASVPQDEATIAALQQLTQAQQSLIDALTARVTALEQSKTASVFTLSVSASASYTNGAPLQGSTVIGQVWIYTALLSAPQSPAPQGNVTQVSYTLDGKAWPNVEHNTPFDFNGGGTTGFWDTKTVPNGQHVITQTITKSDGTSETDSSSFTVAN